MNVKLRQIPMQPFAVDIDLVTGAMSDANNVIVRRTSDMRGRFIDERALEKLIEEHFDAVHHEVFEKTLPAEVGHFQICIRKIYPGIVGDGFFMTKGHDHAVVETAEEYLWIHGKGYILQKRSEGTCVATAMAKSRLAYIVPYWAHHLINTRDTSLVSFCVYSDVAGQNYGDIETEGFPKCVFVMSLTELIQIPMAPK